MSFSQQNKRLNEEPEYRYSVYQKIVINGVFTTKW